MKKLIIDAIKHVDKTVPDETQGDSVKIQMYEFHFSNTLLKLLKIPFLENAYVLLYFERFIRRRDYKSKGRSNTPAIVPGIIRRINQFFLLLYGEKV